jgi:ferritin-like metal-binding protein YciE
MKTLKDTFLEELADMRGAEQQLARALPQFIEAVTCSELKFTLQSHLQETRSQAERLERVFALFGAKPGAKESVAMTGLLDEVDAVISQNGDSPSLNAATIAALQKIEHYEIASYGCLNAWALLLGNQEAAEILGEILDEEKTTNDILNELAVDKNSEALPESVGK